MKGTGNTRIRNSRNNRLDTTNSQQQQQQQQSGILKQLEDERSTVDINKEPPLKITKHGHLKGPFHPYEGPGDRGW